DAKRRRNQPLLGDPGEPGHLAVAVEAMRAGEDVVGPDIVAGGPDRGDAGAYHRRLVADQGGEPDAHPGHVGDGVERTREQNTGGQAKVAQAGHGAAPKVARYYAAGFRGPRVGVCESARGGAPGRGTGARSAGRSLKTENSLQSCRVEATLACARTDLSVQARGPRHNDRANLA